ERNWNRFFRAQLDLSMSVYKLNPLAIKHFLSVDLHRKVTDQKSAYGIARFLRAGLHEKRAGVEPELEGVHILYRHCCRRIKQCARLQAELHGLLPAVQPQLVKYTRSGLPDWLLKLLVNYPVATALAQASAAELAEITHRNLDWCSKHIQSATATVASLTD